MIPEVEESTNDLSHSLMKTEENNMLFLIPLACPMLSVTSHAICTTGG
jgi:hypothetical protein